MEKEFDRIPVWKLTIQLGIPAMVAQFFNIMYSIVDRIYLGHMKESAELALASVGVCAPAFTAITGFASLVGVGGAALMSISLGEQNKEKAQKAMNNSLLMLILVSVVLTGILLAVKKPLLFLLGCSDRMYPLAGTYFTIYSIGTFAVICGTGLNRFIMGQGCAKEGMFSIAIGAVINIVLDPVFIFFLHMGIAGAALATVISQICVLIYVTVVLLRKKMVVRIGFGNYDLHICMKILGIGSMPCLIVFLDNILIILLNAMLRKYGGAMGDQYISDAAVVQSVMVIAICPAEGLTNGCSALFGYYYGAKNYKRILQSFYCVLVACAVYLGLLTVATQICPQSFAKLFLSDQAAIRLTSDFIRKYALGIIFIAIQFAFVDGFTAMGMVKEAIPISLVRKSLYIIATLILPVVSPLEDIFYASSFADIAGAIFTLIIFFAVLKPRLKRSIYSSGNYTQ